MMGSGASIIARELAELYDLQLEEPIIAELEAAISAPMDGSVGHAILEAAARARLLELPFVSEDGAPGVPLVLRDGVLRSQKLFDAEQIVARAIAARLKDRPEDESNAILLEELERFFPKERDDGSP